MAKTSTSFKPGQGGRKPGVQNKINKTVKEVILRAFNDLQEDKQNNILAFARKNPRDFYLIAAKLIPTEVRGQVNSKILLEIVRNSKTKPSA